MRSATLKRHREELAAIDTVYRMCGSAAATAGRIRRVAHGVYTKLVSEAIAKLPDEFSTSEIFAMVKLEFPSASVQSVRGACIANGSIEISERGAPGVPGLGGRPTMWRKKKVMEQS